MAETDATIDSILSQGGVEDTRLVPTTEQDNISQAAAAAAPSTSTSTPYDPTEIVANSQATHPPITTSNPSNQTHYIALAADISAHANLTDALSLHFEQEKPTNTFTANPPPRSELLSAIRTASTTRLTTKLAAGSFIVECGSFAAVACWTPPTHTVPPPTPDELATITHTRPFFGTFLTGIEAVRQKYLYPVSRRFWHLSLMARDPRRPERIKGAVRGVMEPVLEQADRDGVPVWIEAGNERARDVYGWLGSKVVGVVTVHGVHTWCMIRLPRGHGGGEDGEWCA